MTRSRNRSMSRPVRAMVATPASVISSSVTPRPRRWSTRPVQPAGAWPGRKRTSSGKSGSRAARVVLGPGAGTGCGSRGGLLVDLDHPLAADGTLVPGHARVNMRWTSVSVGSKAQRAAEQGRELQLRLHPVLGRRAGHDRRVLLFVGAGKDVLPGAAAVCAGGSSVSEQVLRRGVESARPPRRWGSGRPAPRCARPSPGLVHRPRTRHARGVSRSSSRQPRCRAWSTAVTSAGHHRLDWMSASRRQ